MICLFFVRHGRLSGVRMGEANGRALMNINELAAATGIHRQTVAKRIAGLVPAEGSHCRLKLYDISEAFPAIYSVAGTHNNEPSQMKPGDRKAWYQSENQRIKLINRLSELVPADEAKREMALLVAIVIKSLNSWPDRLKSEKGWSEEHVEAAQLLVSEMMEALKAFVE